MKKTVNSDFYSGQYGKIDIVCAPELQGDVEQYFSLCDVGLSRVECFSGDILYKLALIFDIAEKGTEVAKAIMGLLHRNDIEITMHCATADNPQSVASIKLRKTEDMEKCKDLIATCVAISVQQNKEKEGDE